MYLYLNQTLVFTSRTEFIKTECKAAT